MSRYFIEVFYKGTRYSGFQIQQNANSIQAEIETALKIFLKVTVSLTCSSRTDAGVHALSNYFHFDYNGSALNGGGPERTIYSLNSILPVDIVIKRIYQVADNAHCRYDALSREYRYYI